MQSQIKITNITSEDITEMLTVASPDEVYSFVASHLKEQDETKKALKLKWIQHKTHALLASI